jgi:S1-C subfamily serine protease
LDSKGVVIAEVEGLAMQAGIKEGDLVTGVDGMPIFDLVSFFRALRKGNLARGLKLEISRGGKPLQIEIRELASKLPRGL